MTPVFASSPASSAAEAMSSAPPGGWTGPLALSLSDSKPCLGTVSVAGGLAVSFARLRVCGFFLAIEALAFLALSFPSTFASFTAFAFFGVFVFAVAGIVVVARAALRRGLER